jgi:hypothetical protein
MPHKVAMIMGYLSGMTQFIVFGVIGVQVRVKMQDAERGIPVRGGFDYRVRYGMIPAQEYRDRRRGKPGPGDRLYFGIAIVNRLVEMEENIPQVADGAFTKIPRERFKIRLAVQKIERDMPHALLIELQMGGLVP